jgi:hypothetical protein
MQDVLFFKSQLVLDNMEELLFIWAKANPDYKYQQGMNEILASIIVALASELIFEEDKLADNSSDESDEADDEAQISSLKLL